MSSSYLSVVLSSLNVVITVIHFVVSAWRLHYECTRRSEVTADPRSNRKLWLQMGMCLVLVILGILLLVFSGFRPDDKALEVLLSLIGASLIVFQGGMLSRFYDTYAESLWWSLWGSLFLYFISTVMLSVLIAKRTASKTICHILERVLLSLFVVGYFLISSAYFGMFWRGGYLMDRSRGTRVVRRIFIWNISLCSIALIGALFSFGIYLGGKVDFVTSLWIGNSAATAWAVWVLVMQLNSLRKALTSTAGLTAPLSNSIPRTAHLSGDAWQNRERLGVSQGSTLYVIDNLHSAPSLKESHRKRWDEEAGVQSQDDPWRQDSMTILVTPPTVHYA